MKLIDKDALVAEIEKLERDLYPNFYEYNYDAAKVELLEKIKNFINTFEVKEVDVEKHVKEDIEDVFFDLNGVAVKGATHYLTVEDIKDIARHFFELGLQAQKGE